MSNEFAFSKRKAYANADRDESRILAAAAVAHGESGHLGLRSLTSGTTARRLGILEGSHRGI